jgi:hypothetical protein
MRLHLSFLALAALAACGTPQERCINTATRDLRILTRLIGETETNIARGYALVEVHLTRDRWVRCASDTPEFGAPPPPPGYCIDEVDYTELQPRAIDLEAERAKLVSMKKKQAELNRETQPKIAECRALHPE